MKIRRMRVVASSYNVSIILGALAREQKDHPDRDYEIQQKLGGKFYLVWYDLREVPEQDPLDLLPVPEYPTRPDGSLDFSNRDLLNHIRGIDLENDRRRFMFATQHVLPALKGKLGS